MRRMKSKVAACVVCAPYSCNAGVLVKHYVHARESSAKNSLIWSRQMQSLSMILTCKLFTKSEVLDSTRDERAVFAFVATRRGGTKAKRGTTAKESRAMCNLICMYIVLDGWLGFDRIFFDWVFLIGVFCSVLFVSKRAVGHCSRVKSVLMRVSCHDNISCGSSQNFRSFRRQIPMRTLNFIRMSRQKRAGMALCWAATTCCCCPVREPSDLDHPHSSTHSYHKQKSLSCDILLLASS